LKRALCGVYGECFAIRVYYRVIRVIRVTAFVKSSKAERLPAKVAHQHVVSG